MIKRAAVAQWFRLVLRFERSQVRSIYEFLVWNVPPYKCARAFLVSSKSHV